MSSRLAKVSIALAAAAALCACGSNSVRGQPANPQAEAQDSAAGAAFLAKMAKQADVHRLPSGLEYKIVHSGAADQPTAKLGDEVKVNYQGTLVDGTVFDSSYEKGEPIVFTVGEVIPGWNEALQLMRPGDVWYLYIPADLGYGDRGAGPIPPGSTLVFKVELLGVLPHGGGVGQG